VSALARVLDDVIARYAAGVHEGEAGRARRDYLEATGNMADEEPGWDERMQAFLEWYALERKMDGTELRPIDRYRQELTLSPEDVDAAAALAASHWSLFAVLAIEPGRAHVQDLLGGGCFIVHERRKLAGLEAGDVFETRLYSEGGKTLFGRSFFFHPRDAAQPIREYLAEAARSGDAKQDVLFRLAERRWRSDRSRNVQLAKVYAYRST
jgi:hypothetical protein